MDTLISRLSSRKFILAILTQATGVALCWYGKIDGTALAAITAVVVGGYLASNVVAGSGGAP